MIFRFIVIGVVGFVLLLMLSIFMYSIFLVKKGKRVENNGTPHVCAVCL